MGEKMATNIDILLRTLVVKKASDLHLQAGSTPIFRVNGELSFSDLSPLSSGDVEKYVYSIMTQQQRDVFDKTCRFDFSYSVPGIARFRVNAYRQRGCVGAVMRFIPFEIPQIDDLGLPPIVKELAKKPNGLILITGPTGSGKSTTLAAVIAGIFCFMVVNPFFKSHWLTKWTEEFLFW